MAVAYEDLRHIVNLLREHTYESNASWCRTCQVMKRWEKLL